MKKRRILLIEDDQLMIKLYKTKFDFAGYELNVARTGPEALKSASSGPPDLILLDIVMPGIDGFEVLRMLKKSSKTRGIPVLVLTNLSGEREEVQKAIRLGALDFIKKSDYTPREVVDKVQSVLFSSASEKRRSVATPFSSASEKRRSVATPFSSASEKRRSPSTRAKLGAG